TQTEQLYDHHTMMSLNIGDRSFWMTLAAGVPGVLEENIDAFLDKLLAPLGLSKADIAHWAFTRVDPRSFASWASNLSCGRSSCVRAGTSWLMPETVLRQRYCWCW